MLETSVTYPKEKQITKQPVGTVFAAAQNLWVKINDSQCMILGTGEIVDYTTQCMAHVVSRLGAQL